MARKLQLSIDGIPVDLSRARFANTFDVADGDERLLAQDEEIVYVVVAHVSSARFATGKGGDQVRINALKVKEARLIKNDEFRRKVLDTLGFDATPQPSMLEEGEPDGEATAVAEVPVVYRGKQPEGVTVTLDDEPIETEQSLLEEAGYVEPEDEDEDLDDELDKNLQDYLAKMREISDEYDDPDTELPPGESRVVAEAKGMAESDPILRNFLNL